MTNLWRSQCVSKSVELLQDVDKLAAGGIQGCPVREGDLGRRRRRTFRFLVVMFLMIVVFMGKVGVEFPHTEDELQNVCRIKALLNKLVT